MECACLLVALIGLGVVLAAIVKCLLQPVMWHAEGPVMRGKTIIVTGANTGIGLETTCELARYGGKVIMACRDTRKGETARRALVERLRGQEGQEDVESRLIVKELNLASLRSVRAFAENVLGEQRRIDVLINNAGVGYVAERTLTEDGLELTMGTNHFGHFLLTNLLLDRLKASAPARIIVVSSRGHQFGRIEFDNLNAERSYSRWKAYMNSKLANVHFTRQLARNLQADGCGGDVVVNAVHPGEVASEFVRHVPPPGLFLLRHLVKYALRTPLQGAQTSVFLAASQSPAALVTGKYFKDCSETQPAKQARDDAVAKKLWQVSERLTQLA